MVHSRSQAATSVNSDRLFRYAEAILRERYGVREVLWRRKHNFSQPAPPTLLAEFVGLPGYPVAIVAHPISNNTDAEIRAKAEQIVQQAIALLQSPLRARDLL
jgi:hypothetical protein